MQAQGGRRKSMDKIRQIGRGRSRGGGFRTEEKQHSKQGGRRDDPLGGREKLISRVSKPRQGRQASGKRLREERGGQKGSTGGLPSDKKTRSNKTERVREKGENARPKGRLGARHVA